MKIKNALIGTVATVAALGVIGSLGGEADTADTPVTGIDTDTYAIVESVDLPEDTAPITETESPITETAAPVTQAPVVTQAPAQVLDILSVTSPVECGAMATLTAKGKPGVEYDIDVIYKKTESKAQGLENKTAAADGTVSWTWKVGAGTTPGTFSIYVAGGDESDSIKFTVTE